MQEIEQEAKEYNKAKSLAEALTKQQQRSKTIPFQYSQIIDKQKQQSDIEKQIAYHNALKTQQNDNTKD